MWMSHVTCDTYEWVMSHIWMSHVTHINESRDTHEWVMWHIWIRHITSHIRWSSACLTHMNESRDTYEHVMWHAWIRHVTHRNGSYHTVGRVKIYAQTLFTHLCIICEIPYSYTRTRPHYTWHTCPRTCCNVYVCVCVCVRLNSVCVHWHTTYVKYLTFTRTPTHCMYDNSVCVHWHITYVKYLTFTHTTTHCTYDSSV